MSLEFVHPKTCQEELSKMSEIKQSEKGLYYIKMPLEEVRKSPFNLSKNNYSASNEWLILHLLNLDKLKYKDNILIL